MKNFTITIPKPCHEDWQKMTPTEKGKFCGICTIEVSNFTAFSDEQLLKRLNTDAQICGRFTTNQLDRELVLQRKKQTYYLSYAFTGFFTLLLFNSSYLSVQNKPKTIQVAKQFQSVPLENTSQNDSITSTGIVLDESNLPLP